MISWQHLSILASTQSPVLFPFSALYCQVAGAKKRFDSSSLLLKAEATAALCKKREGGSTSVFPSGVGGGRGGRKGDPHRARGKR